MPDTPECSWPAAPQEWELPSDCVYVWWAALDVPLEALQHFEQTLAEDERQRAARFYFERDRRRYIAQRGLLRWLVGSYLGMDANRVQFVYSEYGKPSLPGSGQNPLSFNLSHSGGIGLLAFVWGRGIGVDVERVRLDIEHEQIAEHFFSPSERAALRQTPVGLRPLAFFNCWTRKEAYLKAYGQGLSLPLDQFDVSLTPGEPARLLATRHAPAEAERWKLLHLEPGPGYVGALAVEGENWETCCWRVYTP